MGGILIGNIYRITINLFFRAGRNIIGKILWTVCRNAIMIVIGIAVLVVADLVYCRFSL